LTFLALIELGELFDFLWLSLAWLSVAVDDTGISTGVRRPDGRTTGSGSARCGAGTKTIFDIENATNPIKVWWFSSPPKDRWYGLQWSLWAVLFGHEP